MLLGHSSLWITFLTLQNYVDAFQAHIIVTILLVIIADNIYERMTLETLQSKFLSYHKVTQLLSEIIQSANKTTRALTLRVHGLLIRKH